MRYSESDERFVTDCLGRPPQGVIGVAARDLQQNPMVIINLPLQRQSGQWVPFPTLYWLVAPELSRRIAEAESKGAVTEIQAMLDADDELMQAHLEDNRFCAKSRWAVLNKEEKDTAEELGMLDVLECSGIGGVANHRSIKCLHAQFAFHLARHEVGSTVGRLMGLRYGITAKFSD